MLVLADGSQAFDGAEGTSHLPTTISEAEIDPGKNGNHEEHILDLGCVEHCDRYVEEIAD